MNTELVQPVQLKRTNLLLKILNLKYKDPDFICTCARARARACVCVCVCV